MPSPERIAADQEVLAEQAKSGKSFAFAQRTYEAFSQFMLDRDAAMVDATKEDVVQFLALRRMESVRTGLLSFFNAAIHLGYRTTNPTYGLRIESAPVQQPAMLSGEDIKSWMDHLRSCAMDPDRGSLAILMYARCWAAYELIYSAGFSRKGLLDIRNEDITKSPPSVLLHRVKSPRRVPITMAALRAVNYFQVVSRGYSGEAGEWLFQSSRPPFNRVTERNFNDALEQVVAEAPQYFRARISPEAIVLSLYRQLKSKGMDSLDLAYLSGYSRVGYFQRKYPDI